jgi:hypothetical protein
VRGVVVVTASGLSSVKSRDRGRRRWRAVCDAARWVTAIQPSSSVIAATPRHTTGLQIIDLYGYCEYSLGMYLRITKRRNANGSEIRYYQLAENIWNAERGYAVAKVLYNFGRADQSARDRLLRLANSILRVIADDGAPQSDTSGEP